jgi:L-alanine-DL-glutamate epimerase-like enolase superfamily enzyme
LKKIAQLAQFNIHSIEQPIMPGQYAQMSLICKQSPIPVALDEELIGISNKLNKIQLIEVLKPAYLIIKPSLIGGLSEADEWVGIAHSNNIGWWATSALESNIGLNAIAQWAASKEVTMPQGLGTAQLYVSNFESPLLVEHAKLFHKNNIPWKLNLLI